MPPDRDLDAAYRATAYTAHTPHGPLALRIGEVDATLDRLLVAHGFVSWAYVTAHNPGSIPTPAEENELRHRQLRDAVAESGRPFYEGSGVGAGWTPEPSLLILGVSEIEAAMLGRRFRQIAIVVGERGAPARLLWLDAEPAE
jgi:hypothetical protein